MYIKALNFKCITFGYKIKVVDKISNNTVDEGVVTGITHKEDKSKNTIGINKSEYCFNDYDIFIDVDDKYYEIDLSERIGIKKLRIFVSPSTSDVNILIGDVNNC